MVLSHRQNFISFEFAALDYAFPEKIQYQYKMEGVDQEWINAGTRRFANYNDLEGGAYAFKVRATNHDGLWKETPISLELRVIPPFWKTTWFMILCAGLVAALVAYRINELSQSKQILEERVSERTRAYEQANQELVRTQNLLVEAAHQAGMAEIAVDVLHNIGNALNSMMVSCDILQEKLQNHQTVELLGKICAKMESGELNLETAQGQTRLIASLRKLVGLHEGVWSEMKEESDLLHEKTLHILDIVRAQQDHAMRATYEEDIFLDQLVQDAIKIQSGSLKKHQVQVVLNVPHIQVRIAKTKLAQVLVNLVKNAIEALKSEPPTKARKICIFVRQLDQHVHLVIEDNGMGIPPENLKRIFNYGFSGKPQGRGFGLHFCANAMTEMNGRILVESPGVGLGSVFTLELPVAGESFAMP